MLTHFWILSCPVTFCRDVGQTWWLYVREIALVTARFIQLIVIFTPVSQMMQDRRHMQAAHFLTTLMQVLSTYPLVYILQRWFPSIGEAWWNYALATYAHKQLPCEVFLDE